MTRFTSYAYWIEIRTYQEKIVAAMRYNWYAQGRRLLVEHFLLLKSFSLTAVERPAEHNQQFPTTKGVTK